MLDRLRGWFRAPEAKSLANPSPEEFELFTGLQLGSLAVTADTALRVPAVAAAVRVISEAAATLDVAVVEIGADGRETPVPSHPVAQLLKGEVNGWTSGFELVRDLVATALIKDKGAAAYVNWIGNEPAEIIHYRAGVIDVDLTAETGEPRYRIGGREIPASSILHVRGPFDRSPVSLAAEAIGLARLMERRAGKLFDTAARPGGVVSFPETLKMDEDALKRAKAHWKAVHESPEASGKTAFLFNGATFEALEFKSTDAQFLELRRFQIEEIARGFNLPAHMIGDLTKANYNSLEAKNREFLSYSLEPWLRALEAAFRRALFRPDDRKRYAVRFDRDDLTRANLTERATAINSLRASEVLSADEGRDWLGMPPRADGRGGEYGNPNINPKQPAAPDGGA